VDPAVWSDRSVGRTRGGMWMCQRLKREPYLHATCFRTVVHNSVGHQPMCLVGSVIVQVPLCLCRHSAACFVHVAGILQGETLPLHID
jgi:hypothetical protein